MFNWLSFWCMCYEILSSWVTQLNVCHLPFHLCSSTASSSTVTLVVPFLDLNILLTCLTSSLTTWHFMYMFNWLSFDPCPLKIKSFMIDCMTCCGESWTVQRDICLASTGLIAAHLPVYMLGIFFYMLCHLFTYARSCTCIINGDMYTTCACDAYSISKNAVCPLPHSAIILKWHVGTISGM